MSSIIVILFSGADFNELLLGTYMKGFAGFAERNWLIFWGSALFGQLMADSGVAKVIAYQCVALARKFPGREKFLAVVSIVILGGVFTYGGIGVFVLVFTMVAIAKEVYMELDIPWHMYTCGPLASGVITLTMLPGTPSIQNILPTEYLGTTTMAAPVMGIILSVIALVIGLIYIHYKLKLAEKRGEGFFPSGQGIAESDIKTEHVQKDFSMILAFTPSIVLFICLNIFNIAAGLSLMITIAVKLLLFYKHIPDFKSTVQRGTMNGLIAIGGTCAIIGFGSVVAAVPAFQFVISGLEHIPGPPIIQLIVAINIAAGITGSSSGGLGIGLEMFGQRFLEQGIPAEVIHRIASISSGGLDSLPHNAAVINALTITRLGHKQGYFNYFFMTVIIPLICVFIGALLYELGIW
ncbi:TPA: GntP family permease [Streptococcus suis]